jgi:TonB family protein
LAATSQDNGQAAYHVVGQFTLGWTSQRKPDEVAQLIANQNRCAFAGADCEPGIHHTIYVDVIAAQSQSSSSLDISGEESLDKTIEEQRHEVAINESAGDPSKLAALSNPPNCKPIVVSRFTLAPTMPPLAIREHHTGTTVLQIVLNSDGTIADIKVYESSGFHELDRAAVQVTWRWSYAPVVCAGSGQPAMATIRVPLTFSLQKKLEPVVPQP